MQRVSRDSAARITVSGVVKLDTKERRDQHTIEFLTRDLEQSEDRG